GRWADRAVLGLEIYSLGSSNTKIMGTAATGTAAVVAAPRITFRVFVRKHGPCRLENSAVCEVLRCDQFQTGRLASLFMPNSGVDFRAEITERSRDAVHIPLLLPPSRRAAAECSPGWQFVMRSKQPLPSAALPLPTER